MVWRQLFVCTGGIFCGLVPQCLATNVCVCYSTTQVHHTTQVLLPVIWLDSPEARNSCSDLALSRRRERPHCVIDPKSKRVTALTSAVQLGAADMTQTLVQETVL